MYFLAAVFNSYEGKLFLKIADLKRGHTFLTQPLQLFFALYTHLHEAKITNSYFSSAHTNM